MIDRTPQGIYPPTEAMLAEPVPQDVRTAQEDAWLRQNTEKHWAGAVVTVPVEVSVMHQWLKAHPEAFMAAFA